MVGFRYVLEVESGVFSSWVGCGERRRNQGCLQIPGLSFGGWWCQLLVEKTRRGRGVRGGFYVEPFRFLKNL